MTETARYVVTLPTAAAADARRVLESHGLLSKAGKIGPRPGRGVSAFVLKLRVDEPRLVFALSDLEALGATADLRDVERRFTAAELGAAAWLHMCVTTGAIEGPSSLPAEWDLTTGCAACERGRRPLAPLPLRSSAMGRSQVRETWHHGFLVVRVGIAEALARAGVGGFGVRPVKSPRASPLDEQLCWLDVDSVWPDSVAPESGYTTADPCVVCGGGSLHSGRPQGRERLVYASPPNRPTGGLPGDVCATRETLGDTRARGWIVSAGAYTALRDLGVRDVRFEPVVFLTER